MPTHFSVHSKFRGGGFDACKREDGVRAGASFSPSYASNDSFFSENCGIYNTYKVHPH
jgi:hypothetical protein